MNLTTICNKLDNTIDKERKIVDYSKIEKLLEELKQEALLEKLPKTSTKQRMKRCIQIIENKKSKYAERVKEKYGLCDDKQLVATEYISAKLVKSDKIEGLKYDEDFPKMNIVYNKVLNYCGKIKINVNEVKNSDRLHEHVYKANLNGLTYRFNPKLFIDLLYLLNMQNQEEVTLQVNENSTMEAMFIKKENGSEGLIMPMRE